MKKKNKEDIFNADANPTYEYININNQRIKVHISWSEGFAFKLEFSYENEMYKREFPPIPTKEYFFGLDDINFDQIKLHKIERQRLADRLNDILNCHFD